MIDDESCNWALRESLAGEVSQRNTITVEEFQYAGPDTRGVRNRAVLPRPGQTPQMRFSRTTFIRGSLTLVETKL